MHRRWSGPLPRGLPTAPLKRPSVRRPPVPGARLRPSCIAPPRLSRLRLQLNKCKNPAEAIPPDSFFTLGEISARRKGSRRPLRASDSLASIKGGSYLIRSPAASLAAISFMASLWERFTRPFSSMSVTFTHIMSPILQASSTFSIRWSASLEM